MSESQTREPQEAVNVTEEAGQVELQSEGEKEEALDPGDADRDEEEYVESDYETEDPFIMQLKQMIDSFGAAEEAEESEEAMDFLTLVRKGKSERVREMLRIDRALVHGSDEDDHSPIHYPAMGQPETPAKIEMAKLLLSQGALVNSRASEFYTPLHIACMMGSKKMCELLLTNGARYDLTQDDGRSTALHEAKRAEIVKILISHGAEVRTKHVLKPYIDDESRKAMLEVYLPTMKEFPMGSPATLADILAKPASLKRLCRDHLRKTMRTLTGGRSIRPLVASLEAAGELTQDSGNFLLCDPPANWRAKLAANLVKIEVDNAGAIGIDLGASSCCVGVARDGDVEIIANELGNKITPAFIGFSDHPTIRNYLQPVIGEAAREQFIDGDYYCATVSNLKSLIGRQANHPAVEEFNQKHGLLAFQDDQSEGVSLLLKSTYQKDFEMDWDFEDFGGYRFTQHWKPEELTSMIVFKMKMMAETHMGALVKDAVLTVPADFNISQRLATREAGLLAGLSVVRIMEEPLAAATAYGLDKKMKSTRGKILIFDQGNGTLDVSVLSSENNSLRVSYTAAEKIREEGIEEEGNNLTKEQIGELASRDSIIKEFLDPVRRAIEEVKIDKKTITDIVIVGVLTKIPSAVTEKLLQNFFPGASLHTSINPEHVIAIGAAMVAARLTAGNVDTEDDGGAASAQDSRPQNQRDREIVSVKDMIGEQLSQGPQENSSAPSKKKQK